MRKHLGAPYDSKFQVLYTQEYPNTKVRVPSYLNQVITLVHLQIPISLPTSFVTILSLFLGPLEPCFTDLAAGKLLSVRWVSVGCLLPTESVKDMPTASSFHNLQVTNCW